MSRMDHVAAAPILSAMNAAPRSAVMDAIALYLSSEASLDAVADVSADLVGAFMDCAKGNRTMEDSHLAAEYLAETAREYANEVCDRYTEVEA